VKNAIGIISVPMEGLISVLYWGITAYDPDLMVPPDPKYKIPLSLDLSLYVMMQVRRNYQLTGWQTCYPSGNPLDRLPLFVATIFAKVATLPPIK